MKDWEAIKYGNFRAVSSSFKLKDSLDKLHDIMTV